MTRDEAYLKLLDTVANDRKHKDYQRVAELADLYEMIITGNNVEKELKRFNPREDEDMFEQRCNLTIPITPAVASSLKTPFNRVPRTRPITRKIQAINDVDKTSVPEIEERIAKFYGSDNENGGLDYFLQNRFVDLSFLDPNSWIIIEFDAFDPLTQKAFPRPFEATSKQAINFDIVNNIVQWLIVETDITYKERESSNSSNYKLINGKKFTIYAENDSVTFTQTSENDAVRVLDTPGEQIIVIEKKGTFIVNYYEPKTEKVPAFRVGYVHDVETAGKTYVNPWHDALCYFKKTFKQGSEFDLSTCLHTFPQKIVRLIKSCPGEKSMRCDRGKLIDGTMCSVCNGTGRPIHTSGQDIIEVALPDTKDELINLSDYIYYVPLPIELLKLQKQWVDELKIDCHQTVFNSTALLRSSAGADTNGAAIAVTATQQNDNMESVYNTLAPFGEKVSNVWFTIVEFIAIITDNKDKVSIIHRFPSNFKLKTRQDLYAERKTLMDCGAPGFVIDAVDDELAEDVYADDMQGLLKYIVKKDHYPFVGKSQSEISMLLNSSNVLKKTKILYNYFDQVFTELDREYSKLKKDFYIEPYDVRAQKIHEKVQQIISDIDTEQQAAFTFKMNAMPPGKLPPAGA